MSFAYNPISTAGGGSTVSSVLVRSTLGVTVAASGADYTSVAAAVNDYQTVVNIIGNTTESGNINLASSGLALTFNNNSTLAMGTNSFQIPTGSPLHVEGFGIITFGNVTGGTLFNGSGSLTLDHMIIQNTSNNAICLTNTDYARVNAVRFEGDVRICGDFNIFSDCIYRNGTVLFTSASNKSALLGAVLETVLIIDSGTNNVQSDLLNG